MTKKVFFLPHAVFTLRLLPLFLALTSCSLLPSPFSSESVKAPPSSYFRLAPVPPPENKKEEPQRLNDPTTEIWRPGYWSYDGESFKWVPGKIMPKPYPTASWCPDRWYKHTYGWGFVPGHWM